MTGTVSAMLEPPAGDLPFDLPPPRRSFAAGLVRRSVRHGGLMLGAGILLVIVMLALVAPLIAPHDPYDQNLAQRLLPPIWHVKGTWDHALGTDKLGRDYLSRLLFGARISLLIGTLTVLISGTIGTLLGVCAGYFGGRVDAMLSYVVTTRLALPVVLVALASAAVGRIPCMASSSCSGCCRGIASRWLRARPPSKWRGPTMSRPRAPSAVRRRVSLFGNPAEHPQRADRCRDAGNGARDPAGSSSIVSRTRRATALAVLGPHDRGRQAIHVFQPLGDRYSGCRAGTPGAGHQPGR